MPHSKICAVVVACSMFLLPGQVSAPAPLLRRGGQARLMQAKNTELHFPTSHAFFELIKAIGDDLAQRPG